MRRKTVLVPDLTELKFLAGETDFISNSHTNNHIALPAINNLKERQETVCEYTIRDGLPMRQSAGSLITLKQNRFCTGTDDLVKGSNRKPRDSLGGRNTTVNTPPI